MVAITDRPEDPAGKGAPEDPEDPGESLQPPTEQEIHDEIANEILRIHEESYGRGAGGAHAFVSSGWVVVVLDELELLPNEKFLVENGKHDTVAQVRTQYQFAIQSSFRAAIERATGRTVIGFASATSIEDGFVTEIFKLR